MRRPLTVRYTIAGVLAALTFTLCFGPHAQAHELPEQSAQPAWVQEEWVDHWYDRVRTDGGVDAEEVRSLLLFLHSRTSFTPPPVVSASSHPTVRTPRPVPASVEHWRPLVAEFFPADQVDYALGVIACESGGDPNITNRQGSGAAGLFQMMPYWYEGRSWLLPAFDPFNPEQNVWAASVLWKYEESEGRRGWNHWVCAR